MSEESHVLTKLPFFILEPYFRPTFLYKEALSLERPALFVGNHTLFGILDLPFILKEIYLKQGVSLKALGDHAHYHFPIWRDLLTQAGMVRGTPENCRQLMQQGQSILVYPGGSREVMRRKADADQLFWKNRTGFTRLALEYDYDIIPFASVGANQSYNIHADADSLKQHALTKKLFEIDALKPYLRDGDALPPIATGVMGLPLPQPQRLYIQFGERIQAADFKQAEDAAWQLRAYVEQQILQQIADLKRYRHQDRAKWSWLRRQLTRI